MVTLATCIRCGALAQVENRSHVYNGVRITESCCLASIEEDIHCPNCGQITQPLRRDDPPASEQAS